MSSPDPVDNIYWAPVDPDAPNNSHAYSLQLIGSNKRVLELGPAAGHFTKALVDNGCRVVGVEVDPEAAERVRAYAERVVVGDLSDPSVVTSAIDDELFDVVVAGDVLEHLPDPLSVLRATRAALKPGGYVVLSVPNVAHADVKLQLLAGRFPYRDTGLLDRTHLTLFTLESIDEMIRDAGLLTIDLRRVTLPVFTTEQAVDRDDVPADVLKLVLDDPESETYQFVVRAVRHDGDQAVEHLAARAIELQADLDRELILRTLAESELDDVREKLLEISEHFEAALESIGGFEEELKAMKSTRSYRMMAPFRALFGRRG